MLLLLSANVPVAPSGAFKKLVHSAHPTNGTFQTGSYGS